MNLTAKIFVILILIMTLAFMFVEMTLFATRENWKRRWDQETSAAAGTIKALQANILEESAKKVQAQAEKAALSQTLIEREATINKQTAEIASIKGEKDQLATKVANQDTIIVGLNSLAESKTTSLTNISKRNSELNQISQVSRSVAFMLNVKLAEIENDLNAQVSTNQRLSERNAALDRELRESQASLAYMIKLHPNDQEAARKSKALPLVEGVVAAIANNPKGEQAYVALTVGSKDGLELGTPFIIINGANYICRVRVERVEGGSAYCVVIPDSWNTNSLPIRLADRALTRF